MEKRFVNGSVPVGGSEMSYAAFGRGEKAFVILPGLSDGLATVKGKARLLAGPYRLFFDKYTVYMFSRKDPLPMGCTIRQMAEDQAKALAALGLEKVCLMGVSEGGMIAQYLAIDHPELVEKLVIAVSAPCKNDLIEENINKWISLAKQGSHKQLMRDTAEKSYSPKYLMKYRTAYPIIGLIGKPKSYDRFLANAQAILGFDASSELERINCPTLIIGGEDDKIVGSDASCKLYAAIERSELYIYPGLGHAAYEEARDVNRRVFEFLEKGNSQLRD